MQRLLTYHYQSIQTDSTASGPSQPHPSGLSCTAQNRFILMFDQSDQFLAGRTQVFAWIELARIVGQIFTNLGGHSQATIGIDIDFADSAGGPPYATDPQAHRRHRPSCRRTD